MPVDDIIEEVSAQRHDYHARQRRPGESGRRSDISDQTVPTTRSPRHSPRAHYDAIQARVNLDRDGVSYFGTVFSIVSGVIRLL